MAGLNSKLMESVKGSPTSTSLAAMLTSSPKSASHYQSGLSYLSGLTGGTDDVLEAF